MIGDDNGVYIFVVVAGDINGTTLMSPLLMLDLRNRSGDTAAILTFSTLFACATTDGDMRISQNPLVLNGCCVSNVLDGRCGERSRGSQSGIAGRCCIDEGTFEAFGFVGSNDLFVVDEFVDAFLILLVVANRCANVRNETSRWTLETAALFIGVVGDVTSVSKGSKVGSVCCCFSGGCVE